MRKPEIQQRRLNYIGCTEAWLHQGENDKMGYMRIGCTNVKHAVIEHSRGNVMK